MKNAKFIKTFALDESGAVTVDWVVLTAAIVGLGLAVMTVVGPAIRDAGVTIASNVQTTATNGPTLFMQGTGSDD